MEKIFKAIAFLLTPLLYPLSLIYGLVIWVRNKVYDKGIYNSIEFSVPTISVGNLSTGGTGKTPHIEYLIRLLNYEYRVATMSRGYKRYTKGFRLANFEDDAQTIGDEPFQLMMNFPDVTVTVCEDRMAGIPELMSRKPQIGVILLDDAFQHRSVRPGINILLTDYHRPFYHDFVLPIGRLREGRSGYKRADLIIVTKCPANLEMQERKAIIQKINPLAEQKIFFTTIEYGQPSDFFTDEPMQIRPDLNIVLVAGLANPQPLQAYLNEKVEFVHLLSYPDHHYFTQRDIEEMKTTWTNWKAENKVIITSQKDAARLRLRHETLKDLGIPIWVLPIQIKFLDDPTDFDGMIRNYVDQETVENQNYFGTGIE